jgi:hypothetical protein
LAITCRNSTFWALVASNFLGKSTQSDFALTHLACSTPPGGCCHPGLGITSWPRISKEPQEETI